MKTLIFSLLATISSCFLITSNTGAFHEKGLPDLLACWVEAWYQGLAVNDDGTLDTGCHTVVVGVLCNDLDGTAVLVAMGTVEIGACEEGLILPDDIFYATDSTQVTHRTATTPPSPPVKILKQYLAENPIMRTQVADVAVSKIPN